MGQFVAGFSMSLDGYVGGPGVNGRLQDWVFKGSVPVTAGGMTFQLASEKSAQVFREFIESVGAFIVGHSASAEIDDNPPFQMPSFVLTHEPRETIYKAGVPITFVTDGIESAFKQAKAAAGDKNVYVFGGANVAQQYLRAGLLDELEIHLIPLLLGGGIRLFDHTNQAELETISVVQSTGVTHFRYRIVK